jgi:RNA polymerase sigma factor (sigma-70 family)
MNPPSGFQDLVQRAQAGDPQAVDQLLALVRPRLEELAGGQLDPEEPAASTADLAQQAWLRAWQKLDQFHGGADDAETWLMFQAWLARIVRRLGLNARRDRTAAQRRPTGKRRRLHADKSGESTTQGSSLDPAASEPTASANAQAEEQAEMIRRALATIPDATDREILRLRFFEGLSLRQVAERVQVNHETVRQRYHAVLRRLQRDLKGLL